jgi:hypothetical protein
MADMTDTNDVESGEGLFVRLVRRNTEGEYVQKDFCGKMTGRAWWA